MRLNGVTTPKFITEQQTMKFLEKKGIVENANWFVCKDSASIIKIIEMIQAIPATNFFTRSGDLLFYSDSSCPGQADQFARSLSSDQVYKIDASYRIGDVMKLIKPVRDNLTFQFNDCDYTVFFFWATFAGKINNNVFEIADVLNKKDSLKIRIIYVNVDFLKSWGMKEIPHMNFK